MSECVAVLQRRDLPLLLKENRPCTGNEAPCGNKRDDESDHSHLTSLSSATIMLSLISWHIQNPHLLK
jgi:hypothetical protein